MRGDMTDLIEKREYEEAGESLEKKNHARP